MEKLDDEINDEFKEIIEEITSKFTYGDTIKHSWLQEKMNINIPDIATMVIYDNIRFQYMENVEIIKKTLLYDFKFYLFSRRSHGYLIVNPNQQARTAETSFITGLRKNTKKLLSVVHNTDTKGMTAYSRKDHNDSLARCGSYSQMVESATKEFTDANAWLKPNE